MIVLYQIKNPDHFIWPWPLLTYQRRGDDIFIFRKQLFLQGLFFQFSHLFQHTLYLLVFLPFQPPPGTFFLGRETSSFRMIVWRQSWTKNISMYQYSHIFVDCYHFKTVLYFIKLSATKVYVIVAYKPTILLRSLNHFITYLLTFVIRVDLFPTAECYNTIKIQ